MVAKLLLKLVVVWVGLSTMMMVIWWYLVTASKPLFPDWWRRLVVDEEPEFSEAG